MGKRSSVGVCAMLALACGGAAGWASPDQPAAAPPAPAVAEKPAPIDVTTADFPALLEQLIDEYQTPEGRAPGAVNGYGLVIQAGAILREVAPVSPEVDFSVLYINTWSPTDGRTREEMAAKARAVIKAAAERGVLELLDQAAAAPRMAMARVGTPERVEQERLALGKEPEVWNGRLVETGLMPELRSFRRLMRMTAARMAEARSAENVAEFTRAFEHGLMLARAATHQASLLPRVHGNMAQAITIDQAIIGVRALKPNDTELLAIGEVFRRQLGRLPSPRLVIGAERLMALDLCRAMFGADGEVDPVMAEQLTGEDSSGMLSGVLRLSKQADNVAAVEDAYSRVGRWWDLPREQRAQADSPEAVRERYRFFSYGDAMLLT